MIFQHMINFNLYLSVPNKSVHVHNVTSYINYIICVLQEGSKLKRAAHLTLTTTNEVQDFLLCKIYCVRRVCGYLL
jgi:hypothetical protein